MSQDPSREAGLHLLEMKKKTVWSVADAWRVLKLFKSMEAKYQKVALRVSFVLLYGLHLQISREVG